MENTLELLDTIEGWIAVFSGTTGTGGSVVREEAHNLSADKEAHNLIDDNIEDLIEEALYIWGADREETKITIF